MKKSVEEIADEILTDGVVVGFWTKEILKTEITGALRKERERAKEAEIQLNAWRKVFGTTQLTHAISKLESAEKRADKAEQKLKEFQDDFTEIMNEKCREDEIHCTCVPHLRKRIRHLEKERTECTCTTDTYGHICHYCSKQQALRVCKKHDELVERIKYLEKRVVEEKQRRFETVAMCEQLQKERDRNGRVL